MTTTTTRRGGLVNGHSRPLRSHPAPAGPPRR
jgi:hypothetical protein